MDAALKRFDDLGAQRTKLESDLKSGSAQEEKILSNELLSHDAGATQLAQCRALLDVVQRRLENVTQRLTESQRAVFSAGHRSMVAWGQPAALSVGWRDAGRSIAAGHDKAKTAIEKGEIGE